MTGNIIGEGFDSFVDKQINIRQKTYGSGLLGNSSRTPEQLAVITNNSAWCRLVSSTNFTSTSSYVNSPSITALKVKENELADKFILFGGTVDSTNTLREGIYTGGEQLAGNAAYGIGGHDFGIRPMPGIQSVSVKCINNGSIRTSTVKIKAFNKTQFDIIDVLYLRVGFSVLLEWGNSTYIDNTSTYVPVPTNSLAEKFLKSNDYEEILKLIVAERKTSDGNYDALFGKVTNFHWSFEKDGTYSITLDIISSGDILDSFKTPAVPVKDVDDATLALTLIGAPTSYDRAQSQKNNSSLNSLLWKILNDPIRYVDKKKRNKGFPDSTYNIRTCVYIEHRVIGATKTDFINEYYVNLGTLLDEIQKSVVYKINKHNLIKFDTDIDTNLIHMYTSTGNNLEKFVLTQTSYDPYTCVTFVPITFSAGKTTEPYVTYGSDAKTYEYNGDMCFIKEIEGEKYGKIMNIYLNVDFILNTINECLDPEDYSIKIIDFLKKIIQGINKSLGGINDLDLHINEETNVVKIINKNPLKNNSKVLSEFGLQPKTTEFQIYGYKNQKVASFIKDFKFTTQLTPEFATMITVSATSNGTVVGEDSTALSKLNKGIYDRYKKDIEEEESPPSAANRYKNVAFNTDLKTGLFTGSSSHFTSNYDPIGDVINSNLLDVYSNINGFVQSVSNSTAPVSVYEFLLSLVPPNSQRSPYEYWDKSYIETFLPRIKSMFRYYFASKNADSRFTSDENPTSGFIPFNLSLTMDGLSGMKIFQKFTINSDMLPSNYPETLEFIINSVDHEISEGKWTTSINSFCTSTHEKIVTTEPIIIVKPPIPSSPGGTSTTNKAYGGLRGDLFSWVPGPNYPDPSDPKNYDGTKYQITKFDEAKRQKLLTFQTKGYIVAILNSTEDKVIARKQDFIKKPSLPLKEHSHTMNCKGGVTKTGYYYDILPFTESEQEQMFNDILTGIGALNTKYNLLWMKVWRLAESAKATYNPWNSTQQVTTNGKQSTIYNCIGVQNYFTFDDGVKATITTMTNGQYPHIIKALQVGINNYAEMKELATLVQLWDMTNRIPLKWQ